MQIEGIGASGLAALQQAGKDAAEKTTGESFASILNEALAQTNETDAADQADVVSLLTGDSDDLHNTVIASEKADIALRLTVQIRNRVIDAYSEIMRMSV